MKRNVTYAFAGVVLLGMSNCAPQVFDGGDDICLMSAPIAGLVDAISATVVLAALVGLWAVWRFAYRRTRSAGRLAQQAAEQQRNAQLAKGPAVVFGAVAMACGETAAARVEVDQESFKIESSGTYRFSWVDVNRRVDMRPFYLVHASGHRVRVEPQERAYLVDALDGMILISDTFRTRFAELSPGEKIYAVGELDRGHDPERADYRGQASGWILRAAPGQDLLLSSEPLDRRFRRRARTVRFATWAIPILALCAVSFWAPCAARILFGKTVDATVTDRECESDSGDGRSCSMLVTAPGGARLKLNVPPATCLAEPGASVPVRYVAQWPNASAAGRGLRFDTGFASAALLPILFGMALVGWWILQSESAWYEGAVVDNGSGKLAPNQRATSHK